MVTAPAILELLRTIDDPEMPISIVDLGIVEALRIGKHDEESGAAGVEIDILPTFVGCPALSVIEDNIIRKLAEMPGVGRVQVNFKFAPPWTVDRISIPGRETLRKFGVTVPKLSGIPEAGDVPPACPFCGSADVQLESSFGPTRCRMIYHCETCKHPFEHLKRLSLPTI